MSRRYKVIAADAIPLGGSIRVLIGGLEIALFRTPDGRFFALENRCPHRGGPLSDAIVTKDGLICPLHNLRIGLEGDIPEETIETDTSRVKRFPLLLKDGYLWIEL